MTRSASCSCGRLTVSVTGEPARVSVCHCLACQRRTGSAFGVQARFDASQVHLEGEALVQLERAYEGMQDHEVAAHIVETLDALDRRDEALEFLEAAEALTPDSHLLEDVRQRLFPDEP